MDNSASLWRTESSAHAAHRTGLVLPRCVPRFGVVSHRGCWQFRVTAFTRRSDRARGVAEQWTVMWRSWLPLGTTAPNLWAEPWTTLRTGCGQRVCPHPVEIVRPRIHSPLSCEDAQPPGSLWTQLGTTSRSPGCGRKKVGKSVEGGRNSTVNRTQGCWWDTGRRGWDRGRTGFGRPLGGVAVGVGGDSGWLRGSVAGAGRVLRGGSRGDGCREGVRRRLSELRRGGRRLARPRGRSRCSCAAGRTAARLRGPGRASAARSLATAAPSALRRSRPSPPSLRTLAPRERRRAPRRPPGAPSEPYAAAVSRS